MTSIAEIYGKSYKSECVTKNYDQYINFLANNIGYGELKFVIPENMRMGDKKIKYELLASRINKVNKNIICIELLDESIIPVLVQDRFAQYYLIVDKAHDACFVIYITPEMVDVY
jgi:hypothetical protein